MSQESADNMNDLEQLKELLFGAEKEALDSIAERVERPEVRTADVADVLAEAIHQSHKKDSELVESLAAPVGECLHREFREDPQTYGDALYPVMGPAIRKSILHALRSFAEQINEAVEQSVSPRGLKWRWQARRAGVPYGEYLLQKTMLYRVEQAYLISRENGLLISHVHHEASKIKDSDAVSAMFTAIQDFVKESFSPDRTGRLESADMGEFTLWAIHGPHALLVCVIRGLPPKHLRADLSAILERIHFRYGDAIRDYKGDTSSFADVENDLERCLRFEARKELEKKKRSIVVPLVLLGLLAALVAFFVARGWAYSNQGETLRDALEAEAGIHVTELSRDGNSFHVYGLKDPVARDIAAVASEAGIDSNHVSSSTQPFMSLQPEIVLERAKLALSPPQTSVLVLDGSVLRVSGFAPVEWAETLNERAASIAGVTAIDASALSTNAVELFEEKVAEASGKRFFFIDGVELAAGEVEKLRFFQRELASLANEARELGLNLELRVIGSTDSTGTFDFNTDLAESRAAAVLDALPADGVTIADYDRATARIPDDESLIDPALRYAELELRVSPAPASP